MRRLTVVVIFCAVITGQAWADAGYTMRFGGENALIEHTMRPTVSASGEIMEAAVGLHDYFQQLQPTLKGAEYVNLTVNWSARVRDQAGNASQAQVIQLRFRSKDLQTINFREVSPQGLLNNYVISVGSTKLGKEMLTAFCGEHGKSAPKFCKKVASS